MDNPERISRNGGATNREKCKTWRIGLEGAVDTAALVRFGFITDSHYAPRKRALLDGLARWKLDNAPEGK